ESSSTDELSSLASELDAGVGSELRAARLAGATTPTEGHTTSGGAMSSLRAAARAVADRLSVRRSRAPASGSAATPSAKGSELAASKAEERLNMNEPHAPEGPPATARRTLDDTNPADAAPRGPVSGSDQTQAEGGPGQVGSLLPDLSRSAQTRAERSADVSASDQTRAERSADLSASVQSDPSTSPQTRAERGVDLSGSEQTRAERGQGQVASVQPDFSGSEQTRAKRSADLSASDQTHTPDAARGAVINSDDRQRIRSASASQASAPSAAIAISDERQPDVAGSLSQHVVPATLTADIDARSGNPDAHTQHAQPSKPVADASRDTGAQPALTGQDQSNALSSAGHDAPAGGAGDATPGAARRDASPSAAGDTSVGAAGSGGSAGTPGRNGTAGQDGRDVSPSAAGDTSVVGAGSGGSAGTAGRDGTAGEGDRDVSPSAAGDASLVGAVSGGSAGTAGRDGTAGEGDRDASLVGAGNTNVGAAVGGGFAGTVGRDGTAGEGDRDAPGVVIDSGGHRVAGDDAAAFGAENYARVRPAPGVGDDAIAAAALQADAYEEPQRPSFRAMRDSDVSSTELAVLGLRPSVVDMGLRMSHRPPVTQRPALLLWAVAALVLAAVGLRVWRGRGEEYAGRHAPVVVPTAPVAPDGSPEQGAPADRAAAVDLGGHAEPGDPPDDPAKPTEAQPSAAQAALERASLPVNPPLEEPGPRVRAEAQAADQGENPASAAGSTVSAREAGKGFHRDSSGVAPFRGRGQPEVDHKQRARQLFQDGHFREAADAYQAAATRSSSDASAFAGLGASALNAGEADRAITAYQRAIQLKPEVSGFRAALGRAYLKKGDRGRAKAAYQKALELDPQNQAARTGLDALKSK
ncbi:MAG: tetratricopeptide repeat protein, partial [Polyangiales bacterium]